MKINPEYNLYDSEWEEGKDGIFLNREGWMIRMDGMESGPFEVRDYIELSHPELFSTKGERK